MSNDYIISIDPDMRKSGVAIVNSDGEIVELKSMTLPELSNLVKDMKRSVFAIEDVNKHGTIYRHNRKGSAAAQARIAQNIGMVKAAGTMIGEIIQDATGRPPILAPLGLGAQVKRNAKLFNQLTGWEGKTNEDTRDAACIGRWVASQLRAGWTIDEKTGQLVRPLNRK